MPDRFASRNASLTGPAFGGFAITPSDSAELEEVTRAIYIGSGGNLAVTLHSGQAVTFKNIADGVLLPVRAAYVAATGTTATDLVGLV